MLVACCQLGQRWVGDDSMAAAQIWRHAKKFAVSLTRRQRIGLLLRTGASYVGFVLRGHRRCLDIPTHMAISERMLLYRLALGLPRESRLLEIGSYLGASAAVLAAAAQTRGGYVFCVDTWHNDAMSEGGRDTYGEFLQNTKPYSNWITPLRGQSTEIATTFAQTIDLLFIDGDHSYDGVIADLRCWLPKLRSGGWLVMHDWGWAEGVKRAVQEVVIDLQQGTPLVLPNLYAVQVSGKSFE